MSSVKPCSLAVACAAAAIAVGLTACGTGAVSAGGSTGGGSSSGAGALQAGPGVDAKTKTISLGVLSPLSGPVAVIGSPLTAGQQTYFKSLNASGGIDGWKVNLVERDTKYAPQTEVQDFNQISGQVAFLAQSLGSPTTAAIQPMADQMKMLVGAAAQDSQFTTDPQMAVIGTPYAVDDANAIDYIVRQKGQPNAKIGIIYQDDAYGQDGLRGYNAGLKTYRFNNVAQATYAATDTDFTAQVQKMRAAGAQYVFLVGIPTAAASVIGTAASEGYNPTWVLQGPAFSEYLMSANGLPSGKPTAVAKALGSHVWVLGYESQWGNMKVPGMGQFLADTKKYAPSQIPDYYYMYGYAEAKVEAAILRKAIAAQNLTRAGILNAKLHLGTVNLDGLMPSVDYTPALGPASRTSEIGAVSTTTPGFVKGVQPFFESAAARGLVFTKSG
jgi:ABC-type branched-subunit amino acid transport system substrate-binding protein